MEENLNMTTATNEVAGAPSKEGKKFVKRIKLLQSSKQKALEDWYKVIKNIF